MAFPDPGHSRRIATMELRRGWRKLREKNPIQLVALGVAVLFGLVFAAGATFGAYVVGGMVAAGEVSDPWTPATLVAAGVWLTTVLFTAYLTALQLGGVDHRDGLLTTVPHEDLAGGLMVAGLLRVVGPFGVGLGAAAVGFGVGVGSPATAALVLVGVLSVLLGGYAVGFAAGLGVKYLLGRSSFVARYKTALGVVAFLAYMGVLLSNQLDEVFGPAIAAARGTPVAWYADLGLLLVEERASPLRAAAILATTGVAVLGGIAATTRVAGLLWYADPVETTEGTTESVAATGRLEGVLDRPTAWVVRKSVLRARRAPVKLLYVVYPAFLLVQPVQASMDAGYVLPTLPATLALYGAWATGTLFALNPLGDEGAVLPVTATTPVTGRQFVGGLVVASVAVGAPVAGVLALVTGLLSPLSPAAAVLTALAGVVLAVGAAGIATWVGFAFPKFEATSITRSREVVMPSLWAFTVYSLVVLLLGSPATAAQVPAVTAFLADTAGVAPVVVRVAGLAVSTALVGVVAWVGVRRAARAFEGYTLA